MFAYALFGASTLMALYILFKAHRHYKKAQSLSSSDAETDPLNPENAETPCNRFDASVEFGIIDGMVCVGWAFLTIGMLFGSLWAKDAWGHYWAWDPKETWAAITWFAYLLYMHYRLIPTHNRKYSLYILVVGFLLLQMCWWGINYLPSAQGTSIHTYNS
jgi:cytochrome c biogenesis protein